MGEVYDLRRSYASDIRTKVHEDWISHWKADRGISRQTENKEFAYAYFYFLKISEIS
jgi:hypothetical protein